MSEAGNNGKPGGAGGWALAGLFGLAVALVITNPHFTFIDDETTIIYGAAQPAARILGAFLQGIGMHEHPPLYDLLLHVWLRLTGERLWALRLPSIAFYVAGIWVLALAAARLAGARAARALVWIAVLWPYGFHYGRLAAWYSFCFLLVALATLAYLRATNGSGSAANWIFLAVSCLALVWANYFGWAVVACLGADFLLRRRRDPRLSLRPLVAIGGLLVVAYLPLARAFWLELMTHPAEGGHRWISRVLYGVYGLYTLAVSESMAPWFWWLGVPAALATAALVLALAASREPGQKFFGYFCGLYVLMMVLGILTTKRLMLIAPWFLLPVATLVCAKPQKLAEASPPSPSRARMILLGALAVTFAIGWLGILFPRHYAAPRFVEPWPKTASVAAVALGRGAIVIGNNPSFFFYLGYAIASRQADGLRPLDVFPYPGVYFSSEWLDAGRPSRATVLFVKGVPVFGPSDPMASAERWLDAHCRLESDRRILRSSGFRLEQRFFPRIGELPWRIEMRRYACAAGR
jgi:hypothetical protein